MLSSGEASVGIPGRPPCSLVDEIMLAEHAHRMTNDMSTAIAALQLCHRRADEASTRTVLATAIERLHRIAQVQRILSKPKESEVDLDVVIEALSKAVLCAYSGAIAVEVAFRLDKVRTGSDFAWRLSTALAEVVSNAIKHAFADHGGVIYVMLTARGPGVRCTVADDGRGAGEWRSKGSGLGCGIVDAIVAGLGGTAARETSSSGSRVTMDFPSVSFAQAASLVA